jgi:hypothetical protein
MRNTETPSPPPARHDVDNRGVLLFAFWLGLSIAIILGLVWIFLWVLDRDSARAQRPIEPQVAVSLRRTPPEPRLEANSLALRRALKTREDAQLTSYGWIDRGARIVHIPIDRAMAMIAEKGVPGGKPIPVPTPAPAPMTAPGTKK